MINIILDFLFPSQCSNCGVYGVYLCGECLAKLQTNRKRQVCHVCRGNREECSHSKCKNSTLLNNIDICFERNSIAKKLLRDFKYNLYFQMADYIAHFYIEVLRETHGNTENLVLVPVPLHRKKQWSRGFNQTKLISKSIAKKIDCEVVELVKREKNTRTQVGLTKQQRQENLRDAFIIEDLNISGEKVIILVDDVMTSGTTLEKCAEVIKRKFTNEVSAIVLYRD